MADFSIGPHTEIVFSVSELEKNLPFYTEALGMTIAHRGKANVDNFYQISTETTNEVLLVRGEEAYGNIRLLEFKGVPQELMRPNGCIWDAGGIFDFDLRVVNIEKTMKQLREYDWRGHAESVTYSTGPLTLNEGFLRGPDDIVLALIERTAPPLPNQSQSEGVTSNVFNSAMIVSDYEKSRDFFINILGFHVYHEDVLDWEKGPNIFGLPHNLADKGHLQLLMLKPQEDINVTLEIAHLPHLEGTNFASKTRPPNLGILSYRLPVENIVNFYRYINERDVTVCSPLQTLELKPYGTAKAFAIETPDGAWMEFYEVQ